MEEDGGWRRGRWTGNEDGVKFVFFLGKRRL